ncbi:MAG: hypothetical protein C4519_17170 [Desulfobacteraceae bacterium]|nr:MAG: hypothetical protein C4519_17170 [Desulfobacteraceae bacterium]
MIRFLLQELEKTPHPTFSKNELLAISPTDFEKLTRAHILEYRQPDPSGMECIRHPRCSHGCGLVVLETDFGYEAFCPDHPEEDPISLTEANLPRYVLSVESLLHAICEANGWPKKVQPIEKGCFFIAYNEVTGILFVHDLRLINLTKLSGIKNLIQQEALVVLTPISTGQDLEFIGALHSGGMVQAALIDVLNPDNFQLSLHGFLAKIPSAITAEQTPKSIFPSPPDLRWEEVVISFVSNDSIRIQARGKSERFTFAEIGFKDGRKGDLPDSIWKFFRDGLAANGGEIHWKTKLDSTDKGKLKAIISKLRARLKSITGLKEDPFFPYRRTHGYNTKFTLIDSRYGND